MSFNPLQVHKKRNYSLLLTKPVDSFNPLQVHKKHYYRLRIYYNRIMFQSPIGTQKTHHHYFPVFQNTTSFNPLQVHKKLHSCTVENIEADGFNPLQVHKKQSWPLEPAALGEVFQSPIGTQKTQVGKRRQYDRCRFQSPIGTQKTCLVSHKQGKARKEFQSPIGTQKTAPPNSAMYCDN